MFDTAPPAPLHFDLDRVRLDTVVQRLLTEKGSERRAKDRLTDQILQGDHTALRPERIAGFEGISQATANRAMFNVIDFFFEQLVLASMKDDKRLHYFISIEASIRLDTPAMLDFGRPIVIETVHHVAVFSMIVLLAARLRAQGGKDRIILLHQAQRPEPRLEYAAQIIRNYLGFQTISVPMTGNWFRQLSASMSPTTVLLYLGDMPPDAKKQDNTRRELILSDKGSAATGLVETLSAAARLADLLGADHFTLDYPDPCAASLKPAASAPLQCPLKDWVFWPALASAS